jgi:hypothetical protein
MFYLGRFHTNYIISGDVEKNFNYFFQGKQRIFWNIQIHIYVCMYVCTNMWNLQRNHYSTLKCSLNDMLLWVLFTISYLEVRMGENLTLEDGCDKHWWRVAFGISVGGDALPSLARMDLEQQPHTLSSIWTLFLTQLWMNSNWKYPIGFISNKVQNRLPMGWTPTKKELSISFSFFWGLF